MIARKISWKNVKYHWEIYLFILPTLVLMGLFVYYPASNGLIHSFFNVVGAGRSGPAAVAEIADAVRAGLH